MSRAGVVALLALCGAILRFVDLDRKPYWFDEVFTALRVSGYDEHDHANPRLFTGRVVSSADIQTFQKTAPDTSVIGTVRGLARKEPQWTPAYFVLARLVTQWWGDTVTATRALAAFWGVLSIAAMYWLGREWSGRTTTAWFAAGLTAVSPLLIRYSQEARPYSMWVLMVLLASAVFVRMTRSPGKPAAALYSLLVIAALYTNLLSVLVVVAHGACLACLRWPAQVRRRFAMAAAAAGVALFPWIWVLVLKGKTMPRPPPIDGLQRLAHDAAALFIGWPVVGAETLLLVPVLLLVAYAFYFLFRTAPGTMSLFVLLLALVPVGALVLWDAVFGSQRSSHIRYMLPCSLAVQLAVAHLLAGKTEHSIGRRAFLWRALAVAIIVVGLASSAAVVRADSWWGLAEVDLDVARIISQSPRPLVITDVPFGVVAIQSHLLEPSQAFLLTKEPETIEIPEGYETVFVYQPSDRLLAAVRSRLGSGLGLIYRKARWEGTVYSLYRWQR